MNRTYVNCRQFGHVNFNQRFNFVVKRIQEKVITIRQQIDIILSVTLFTCVILYAFGFSMFPSNLIAAEPNDLEVLLELDPLDWATLETGNIINQCSFALKQRSKLKKGQETRLLLLRAQALIMDGNDAFALRDLNDLLSIEPKDTMALRIRGELFNRRGNNGKAQEDFERLINLQPKAGIGYADKSIVLTERGVYEESKKLAAKAILLDPEEPQGYRARALAYLREEKYHQVIKDLDQCIKLSYGYGRRDTLRLFLMRAFINLYIYDNPKKAFPDLLMARGIDKYSVEPSNLFCMYYFKTEKYNLAFKISESTSAKRSKNSQIKLNYRLLRVKCLMALKRYMDAKDVAEDMVRDISNFFGGYLSRGFVFFAQNKYEQALKDYDKSLNLSHDNIGAMAAKAYLLASCQEAQYRNGPAAKALAKKCCERTEYQVPRQLMLLAMSSAECGDYKEAVRWAKKSIDKADSNFPFMDEYRERLALFEKGKPFRYTPGSGKLDFLFP